MTSRNTHPRVRGAALGFRALKKCGEWALLKVRPFEGSCSLPDLGAARFLLCPGHLNPVIAPVPSRCASGNAGGRSRRVYTRGGRANHQSLRAPADLPCALRQTPPGNLNWQRASTQ